MNCTRTAAASREGTYWQKGQPKDLANTMTVLSCSLNRDLTSISFCSDASHTYAYKAVRVLLGTASKAEHRDGMYLDVLDLIILVSAVRSLGFGGHSTHSFSRGAPGAPEMPRLC